MERASADWNAACGVCFRQARAGESALFRVVSWDTALADEKGAPLIAAAFFPDTEPDKRILYVFWPTFTGTRPRSRQPVTPRAGYPQLGVLRHELGHILGLAHEEERVPGRDAVKREVGVDIDILNVPDPRSIMRAQFAAGEPDAQCALTETDKALARYLYGLPDPVVQDADIEMD